MHGVPSVAILDAAARAAEKAPATVDAIPVLAAARTESAPIVWTATFAAAIGSNVASIVVISIAAALFRGVLR